MTKQETSPGCCAATSTKILAAIKARLALESGGVTNPDFKRGLEVALYVAKESISTE